MRNNESAQLAKQLTSAFQRSRMDVEMFWNYLLQRDNAKLIWGETDGEQYSVEVLIPSTTGGEAQVAYFYANWDSQEWHCKF